MYFLSCICSGEHAKQTIVSGIIKTDKMGLDQAIVGRGMCLQEDLWAFNEPEVVEAVFNVNTYHNITAGGHDRFYTH